MTGSDVGDLGEAPSATAGPGRGRWDRGTTDDGRRESARARLLDATARVVASRGGSATVTEIIGLAGIGRNTFYEHFASVDAAVSEVVRGVADAVGNALHSSAAPAGRPESDCEHSRRLGW